jgi:hypothetical protein
VAYTRDALSLSVSVIGKVKPGSYGSLSWSSGASLSYRREDDLLELSGTVKGAPWSQALALDFTQTDGVASGRRVWLSCPQCVSRCRSLYFLGARFLCRTCQGLRYRSKSIGELDRAWIREGRIARKINPSAGTTDFPTRPKGMQRRTFEKLYRAWCEADGKREEITTRELVGIALRYYSDGL